MIGRGHPVAWRVALASPSLLVVLSLLLSGCVPAGPTQLPPTVKLKVVTTPQLTNAPVFIAQEEGFFAEQGLQVEFVKLTNSREGIPALANGDIDVLTGAPNVGILNAMAHDSRLSFVAGKGVHAPDGCANGGLIARKALIDSGAVKGPADIRGRRIATERATSSDFLTQRLLARGGLTIDDVTVVSIPDSALPQAFLDGTIDFAQASEPALSHITETGAAVLWAATRDYAPDYPIGVVTFGPNLLDKTPAVGERFMVAYLEAVRQYNQGKTERNLEILGKSTELDKDFLMRSCWPSIRADGTIHLPSVLAFQTWAIQQGLLDTPAPQERLWTSRFVDAANKKLGAST